MTSSPASEKTAAHDEVTDLFLQAGYRSFADACRGAGLPRWKHVWMAVQRKSTRGDAGDMRRRLFRHLNERIAERHAIIFEAARKRLQEQEVDPQ